MNHNNPLRQLTLPDCFILCEKLIIEKIPMQINSNKNQIEYILYSRYNNPLSLTSLTGIFLFYTESGEISMNIKNLTIREIDDKIRPYVNDYFKDNTITNYAGELLTESYTIGVDEMAVDLHLPKDTEYVNSKSGCIYLSDTCGQQRGYEYIIILVSTVEQSTALYLILQKISEETGDTEHIILKNFIESEE